MVAMRPSDWAAVLDAIPTQAFRAERRTRRATVHVRVAMARLMCMLMTREQDLIVSGTVGDVIMHISQRTFHLLDTYYPCINTRGKPAAAPLSRTPNVLQFLHALVPPDSAPEMIIPATATKSQRAVLLAVLTECMRKPEARMHPAFMLTGDAGTGKSWVVQQLVKILGEANTVITSTTGAAAVSLGDACATTLHSALGMQVAENKTMLNLQKQLRSLWLNNAHRTGNHLDVEAVKGDTVRSTLLTMWKAPGSLPLFVIDEIGMLGARTLDAAMRILVAIALVFHGREMGLTNDQISVLLKTDMRVQPEQGYDPAVSRKEWIRIFHAYAWRWVPPILCTGDFFQLEPVHDKAPYTSPWWMEALQPAQYELTEQMRQLISATDAPQWIKYQRAFVSFLSALRCGKATDKAIKEWTAVFTSARAQKEVGDNAPTLVPRNDTAKEHNVTRLKALKRPTIVALAYDTGPMHLSKQLEHAFEERVELAVGASVRLCKNMDTQEGLANSVMATIVGIGEMFAPRQDFADYTSPRLVGWSIDDQAGFVRSTLPAFSKRVPLHASDYTWLDHRDEQMLRQKHITPVTGSVQRAAPYLFVEIELKHNKAKFIIMATRAEMRVRPLRVNASQDAREAAEAASRISATRMQIPLSLAWSYTINRAQGRTLEEIIVDGAKSFEPGQAYTALSRAKRWDRIFFKSNFPAVAWKPSKSAKDYVPF